MKTIQNSMQCMIYGASRALEYMIETKDAKKKETKSARKSEVLTSSCASDISLNAVFGESITLRVVDVTEFT